MLIQQIQLSNKNIQTTIIHSNMNTAQKNYMDEKKPDTKECIPYDFMYIKLTNIWWKSE